ncbi:hypothetical protein [Oceanobacillus saliphilus]|uniref:hypothetical protein n=1 Tax=Oceanobacillus saliphilus TaxID=2925834 RepID=UPI00201E2C52|nr:hypothetical protein [Oceanobacillus saliphilus]
MKNFMIIAISFLILFSLFQVISGMLLTLMYTPNITEAWNVSANLSQEVIIESSNSHFILTLFLAFLSAVIAYFILKKITKYSNSSK